MTGPSQDDFLNEFGDLSDEAYADPAAAEARLDQLAMEGLITRLAAERPMPVPIPLPKPRPWLRLVVRVAACVAFLLLLILAVVAYDQREQRKRSDLARDLHEAKSKSDLRVRSLIERARARASQPRYGRVTESRQILMETRDSLRDIDDKKVVEDLEFQIRSAFAATLPLLDVRPGEQLKLAADGHAFWPIAAHPDGKSIAIATTGGPVVWKKGTPPARAKELRPLIGARLLYSPDGTYLAVLHPKGGLALYDRDATRKWADLEPEGKTVYLAAVFLPDGKTIRACAAGLVRTWDVPSRKQTDSRPVDVKGMTQLTAASFDSKGERILVGDSAGGIRLLPVDGKEGPKLPPMSSLVETVAWAPDGGSIAVGCRGSALLLRDSGTPLLILTGLDMVETLNFSPDGRLLLGGQRNNNGRIWDTQTGEAFQVPHAPIAVCGDGRTLAATSTESVFFHELIVPTVIVPHAGHHGPPVKLGWSAGSKGKDQFFATLDHKFQVRVWKAGQSQPLLTAPMPGSDWFASNGSLALSKDARRVAFANRGSNASLVRVLDVATGKGVEGGEWSFPAGEVTLVPAEDGAFLCLREERSKDRAALQTVVYELTPGKPAKATRVLREAGADDKAGTLRVGVTSNGLYWWAGPELPADKRRVEVREIATGKLVTTIPIGITPDVLTDPAGKTLWVAEGEKAIRRFDLTRPTPGVRQDRMPGLISTDGKWAGYVPTPEAGEVPALVLERAGKPYLAIRRATAPVLSIACFSPDEERYACWGYHQDGTVMIADLPAMERAVDGFMREARR